MKDGRKYFSQKLKDIKESFDVYLAIVFKVTYDGIIYFTLLFIRIVYYIHKWICSKVIEVWLIFVICKMESFIDRFCILSCFTPLNGTIIHRAVLKLHSLWKFSTIQQLQWINSRLNFQFYLEILFPKAENINWLTKTQRLTC